MVLTQVSKFIDAKSEHASIKWHHQLGKEDEMIYDAVVRCEKWSIYISIQTQKVSLGERSDRAHSDKWGWLPTQQNDLMRAMSENFYFLDLHFLEQT